MATCCCPPSAERLTTFGLRARKTPWPRQGPRPMICAHCSRTSLKAGRSRRRTSPDLRMVRNIARLTSALGLQGLWLPTTAVFLDLSPELAIERISSRGAKKDRHESQQDLAQAREMYLRTLSAFELYCGGNRVVRV